MFWVQCCDVHYDFCLYLQLFIGGLMSYLRYLWLFVHSGVQRILRDGCSFCWHWWDCWSSLFKLSFLYNLVSHGSTDINKCQRISKGQLKMDFEFVKKSADESVWLILWNLNKRFLPFFGFFKIDCENSSSSLSIYLCKAVHFFCYVHRFYYKKYVWYISLSNSWIHCIWSIYRFGLIWLWLLRRRSKCEK
jgi:hypothetical protein